ncbi:hotdog domain-containing protein [Tistrella bauzanensis]
MLTLAVAAAIWLGLARAPRPRAATAPESPAKSRAGLVADIRGTLAILVSRPMRRTALLAAMSYPALITLRGLWLGPFLQAAHGLGPVAIGNIVLGLSVVMVAAPLAFGRLDRAGPRRRALMRGGGLLAAAGLVALGLGGGHLLAIDLVVLALITAAGSFYVLQFAVVRASVPPEAMGRALSGLIFCFFAGVAVWQVLTGLIADSGGATQGLTAASGPVMASSLAGADAMRLVFLVLGAGLGAVTLATTPRELIARDPSSSMPPSTRCLHDRYRKPVDPARRHYAGPGRPDPPRGPRPGSGDRMAGDVAALASAPVIWLAELACMRAVAAYLPQGATTVGVGFDIRHTAPTAEGMEVTITARLLRAVGRSLLFEVRGEDGAGVVLDGRMTRHIAEPAAVLAQMAARCGPSGHAGLTCRAVAARAPCGTGRMTTRSWMAT